MIIIADGSVKIDVLLDDSKVSGGIKKVEGRLGGIGGAAKRGLATVGKLAGALGLVGLAYKGIDMVKNSLDGAIDRYDTLNNFPRVMQQMGFDAEASQGAIDKLSDGIQGLPTRLDEVASTAQNIAVMTGDLEGAVDTTLALNNAFLASGASTADAERGLQQYVQMLAKGEVDLQSWRTLQETMPYALRETAEAFGFTGESATNDFYDALKAGDITMTEFNDKLIELDTAQGGFAETAQEASGGIRTAWTNMGTWIATGVADIIGAIDEALGGTGSLEGAINSLKPVVQGVFGFIADTAIPAVADAIQFLKDKFNEYRPAVENVIDKMEPLIQVFQETRDELMGQFAPIWENLKGLFEDMMPILELLGTLIGGVLLTAIIVWTSALNGVQRAIGPVINALISLIDFIVNVVNTVIALLTGDFTGALEYWNAATEASVEFFKSLWDGIVGFVTGIVDAVIGWFEFLYDVLVGNSIIPDMVNAIIDWFAKLFKQAIKIVTNIVKGITNLFNGLKSVITAIWNAIKNVITSVLNAIRTVVSSVFNGIRNIITSIMNGIRSIITSVWNAIRSVITSVVNAIRSVISSTWNGIRNIITTVTNAIRNTISNIFNSLRGIVSSAMNGVKSAVSSGIRGALNIVTNIASSFYNAGRNIVTSIANGIRSAVGFVTDAIGNVTSKIRDFLPFSPAKEGALRDIMNVRIAESIGEAIEKGEGKAIKSMRGLTDQLAEEANIDLLSELKGVSANGILARFIPTNADYNYKGDSHRTKTSETTPLVKQQPAYITLVLGGREYSAFVRDITETQERTRLTLEAFRG